MPEAAAEMADAEAASVLLWDTKTNELRFASTTTTNNNQSIIGSSVPLEGSIAGTVLRENRVVIVEDAGIAYRMQVYENGKARDVGNVFSGTTNESRAMLDAQLAKGRSVVAEVRYLYATDNLNLFQPVFVRARDDKAPKDCSIEQLKRTNKDVVDHD